MQKRENNEEKKQRQKMTPAASLTEAGAKKKTLQLKFQKEKC